ncbi:MAG TPA: aspartate aminotransferase family protein [Acidisarcina sp.]|nr:aspartate aminotransferase family protein [Acidisarcina sp.]
MITQIDNCNAALDTGKSKDLYQRSLELLIEGSSSPSRGPANYGKYPLYMQSGKGSRIWDANGNEYVDWMMGFGVVPLGHADASVTEAIYHAATTGAHFATATEIEVELAEAIQRLVPSAERVRFTNTGTESVMAAMRLARGYTGRAKIVKFEGHYHGWWDDVLLNSHPMPVHALGLPSDPVKIPDSSGLNRHAQDDTIVVPWNDLPALERAIANHPGQIAAILTEGVMSNMGVIPQAAGYLKSVEKLARKNGILFVLDETVTGFRVSAGGCQEYYGLSPDISTLGKALGCGLPVAAVVGRAEIMNALGWGGVLHYGTQNGSRIGLFAARANLKKLTANDGEAIKHSLSIAEAMCDGLSGLFTRMSVPAIVQRVGPLFQIMFTERSSISNYREYCGHVDQSLYRRFVQKMLESGIYMTPAPTLHFNATVAHTEEDVSLTLDAAERALRAIGF